MERNEREKTMQKLFDNDQIVNRVVQALNQNKEQEE